jgi:hypothetical protein
MHTSTIKATCKTLPANTIIWFFIT